MSRSETYIGPYRIIDPFLGSGGQAQVVEAERDGKRYALKLMARDETSVALARFTLEAEILRAIDHPNIVQFVDSGTHGDWQYIAMPRLPGRTLRREIVDSAGHGLEPLRVLEIARQAALALKVFHQLGAVHRDVKPENLQIDPAQNDHVWLLDAGCARFIERGRITRADMLPGTDGYRAPELTRGLVTPQADFFALGVVIYEAIAGHHPFAREDPTARVKFLPLEAYAPSAPRFIVELVDRLLESSPSKRPQNADELLTLLEDPAHGLRLVQRERLSWTEASAPPVLFHVTRRNRDAVAAAAAQGIVPSAYFACAADELALTTAASMSTKESVGLLVDSELHRLAFVDSQPNSRVWQLPYAPPDARPYSIEDGPRALPLRDITTLAIDVMEEHSAVPLIPAFLLRDATPQGWLAANAAILDHAVALLEPTRPFLIDVPIAMEGFSTPRSRARLAEAVFRSHPEAALLRIEGLSANPTAEQVTQALELATVVQSAGVRPILVGAAAAAPIFLAFGIGVAYDLVGETEFTTRLGAWAQQRFEFPSLFASLRADDARAALESGLLPEADCWCPSCQACSTVDERLARAVEHNAAMAVAERARASDISSRAERLEILGQRLQLARGAEMYTTIGAWEQRIIRLAQLQDALTKVADTLRRIAA